MGLAAVNSVKCRSWPSSNLQPLWSHSLGDMSTQCLCPISMGQCLQHRRVRTLVVDVYCSQTLNPSVLLFITSTMSMGFSWSQTELYRWTLTLTTKLSLKIDYKTKSLKFLLWSLLPVGWKCAMRACMHVCARVCVCVCVRGLLLFSFLGEKTSSVNQRTLFSGDFTVLVTTLSSVT